jgi:Tfp pilus assembly protein PilF
MAAAALLVVAAGLAEAITELRAGRVRQAEAMLRRILAADANSAEAWKWLGVAYASQDRHDAAETPFRNACRLAPRDADACYFFGRSLYAQNRFEPALEALAAAFETGVRPGRARLAMAQTLEALGRSEEAERRFREAVESARSEAPAAADHPALHYGVFLMRQGRTGEAVETLRKAPGSARAHFELGRAYYQLEKLPAAVDELRQAVRLDAVYGAAHLLLGKAYGRLGKEAEAARHTAEGERLVKVRER